MMIHKFLMLLNDQVCLLYGTLFRGTLCFLDVLKATLASVAGFTIVFADFDVQYFSLLLF